MELRIPNGFSRDLLYRKKARDLSARVLAIVHSTGFYRWDQHSNFFMKFAR